jgi:outer membrane protein assembly factor BamB
MRSVAWGVLVLALAGCAFGGGPRPAAAPPTIATTSPGAATEAPLRGAIRIVHAIECCYVEGGLTGIRVSSIAGAVVVRREHRQGSRASELAVVAVAAGRYRVQTWERPCEGTCARVDPPIDRCSLDVAVRAGATTEVRVRVIPGSGCVADTPASPVASDAASRAGLPWWPTTLVEIDPISGAVWRETPIDLRWPSIIGTGDGRPVYLTEAGGRRRLPDAPFLDVWTATAAHGLIAASEQPTGRLVVYGLDGARRWARPVESDGFPAAIGEGVVVQLDRDGTAHALDARDGHRRWTMVGPFRFVVALGSSIVLGGGDASTTWRVIDARAGRERSRATLDGGLAFGSDPVMVGRWIVGTAQSADGSFETVAADRETGAIAWQRPADAPSDRLVAAGNLVVVAGAGRLVALDARTGKARWHLDGAWKIDHRLTDPAYADQTLFALRH